MKTSVIENFTNLALAFPNVGVFLTMLPGGSRQSVLLFFFFNDLSSNSVTKSRFFSDCLTD